MTLYHVKNLSQFSVAIMNKELLIKQDGDLVMGTGLNNLRHIRSDAIITDMDYLNVAMLSFELFLAVGLILITVVNQKNHAGSRAREFR